MRYLRFALIFFLLFYSAMSKSEESNPLSKLAWQLGPSQGIIGDKATINIPDGYAFLGATDTQKFMELNQNPSSGNEYLLAPKNLSWFVIFHFNPIGYVKDDETIDADEVLETAKKGAENSNAERRQRGWSTLSIVGWRIRPQYDKETKLLEWAFLDRDDKTHKDIINYNTRLLGREGVMEVVLVADPDMLDTSVGALKTVLTGYQYVSNESYAEYRQGDKVAEYGLAALVAGGAAAVAAKKGFFAVILGFLAAAWKFVIAAAIGGLAWLKSLFKKKDQ
jgi:uncharacterized membrane-anchored protein